MSGSPILAGDKSTIGVICNGMVGHGPSGPHTPLIDQLPLWLLRFLCVLDRSDPAVKLAAIEPEPPISDDSV
jgi:V8-like Glu-specific endopeptidase